MKKVSWILTILLVVILLVWGFLSLKKSVETTTSVNESNQIVQAIREEVQQVLPSPRPSPSPTLPPLPSTKMLTQGTQVFQSFNNCGPAALSMALSNYGIAVSQQQLGQELRPFQNPQGDNDDKSVTLGEIAVKAKQYGFIVYHRPAGDIDLIKQFIAMDIPVLARTWLKPNEDIGHFRVVTGYDENARQLIQDDSLQGADLRYNYEAFDELWRAFSYEFVVLVPQEKQAQAETVLGSLLDEKVAWQKSLQLAETTLSTQPNDVYAQFNKSVALHHLGQYQQSVEAFEAVQNRLPSRMLWYQLEPILAYYQVGNHQKVLQLVDNILDNHNRAYSELYYLKALVYESAGNQSAAQENYALADRYNSSGSWKVNVESVNNQ